MKRKGQNRNIRWHASRVSRRQRQEAAGQRGCIVWLTGLSGSGKSTVGRALEADLIKAGRLAYVLDGDNVRHGLNSDLGFTPADRTENIRRVAHVAAILAEAGIIVITAFISPYRQVRRMARKIAGPCRFFEVFLDAPLAACMERDPKGLYNKAKRGKIKHFTGIKDPYERPAGPELVLKTAKSGVAECVKSLKNMLIKAGIIKRRSGDI
ncbi:MAG: adenylyl-sulfate kinase [Planctomycetes bacterium]|nr:adenylyl-sulfate kinase [Planctomycetota bacterium]